MSISSLQSYAEEYFGSLNSIAERISLDVAVTKNAYENLWHTLSYKDQSQIIDETIIHPEAVLKYSIYHSNEVDFECFPRLRLQTGDKYVLDEEGKGVGSRWRDEHSAPFTWMTQSQLNLCINEESEQEKRRLNSMTSNCMSIKKESRSPEKKMTAHANVSFLDPPSIVLGGSSSKVNAANSRLKFPIRTSNMDDSLLSKLKSKTAVLLVPAVNASIRGTGADDSTCKVPTERKRLVDSKNTYMVVSSAKTPKSGTGKHIISKPKTPPPPPPPAARQKSQVVPNSHADSEKVALLQENSADELDIQPLKLENNTDEITHFSDSKNSLSFRVELQAPSNNEVVPKTGFDFLDNW